MAIYVYRTADGTLVSWCPKDSDPVAPTAQLTAQGLAMVLGLPALDASHAWDASTRTVVTVALVPGPAYIPTWKFILLFTPAEHAAIKASADAMVQHFFDALKTTQTVDLNDPVLQQGLNYLVSVSLLTAPNAALILSGRPSL
jgi:hypothetical protein